MNSNINKSSNKSFGVVFFLVFLAIGLYPLLNDGNIRTLFIIISFLFLILGLINSKILTPLNNIWFKFAGRFSFFFFNEFNRWNSDDVINF